MRKKLGAVRPLKPINYRMVSPVAFVKLVDTQRSNIASARFIPPKLGEKGFGRSRVEFNK